MIDLSTEYLGRRLTCPLVVSASPLTEELDNIRRFEDAGAGAVVMHSLFEEQIDLAASDLDERLAHGTHTHPEALTYLPEPSAFAVGPDGYLEQIRRAKAAVRIPVIASLNGVSTGGWVEYAGLIESAGADGLELNVYQIPADPSLSGSEVEHRIVELVREIRARIRIPLAVKLSPFFSAPLHLARRLDAVGANALVLFNRFYQPDFDIEALWVAPHLTLSRSSELLLRLHWVGIIFGHIQADLAVTGGVHSASCALKSLMAGARVAMMTSALLAHGIGHLTTVRDEMIRWMEKHEYVSVSQMIGSMSHRNVADPTAFERGNYMRVLREYSLRRPAPAAAGVSWR